MPTAAIGDDDNLACKLRIDVGDSDTSWVGRGKLKKPGRVDYRRLLVRQYYMSQQLRQRSPTMVITFTSKPGTVVSQM